MRISHEQQELYLNIPVPHFNLISVLPHTESGVAKYHVDRDVTKIKIECGIPNQM